MSSSAINQSVFQAKVSGIQNQADSTSIYSNGVWSFKNSTALTSVTITDAGRVGIGTASPSSKLHVIDGNNTFITNDANTYPRITTDNSDVQLGLFRSGANAGGGYIGGSGTAAFLVLSSSFQERMRIDASGNLLVGKTAVDLTTTGMSFATASGVRVVNSSTSGSVDAFEAYSSGAGAYRFYVAFNGVISATSTTINAISDRRLKENIRDLDEGLSAVLALKPRKFDWKEGKGADIKDARGFIAQEFERVFPDLISEWKDPAPEGEEPYKSVRPDLIPVLVKAIQELSAKVDAQAAEIEALKAK